MANAPRLLDRLTMKRWTLICALMTFLVYPSIGQDKSFGVELITRYDRHANYETNYAGRVYNDHYKLWGTSFGANIFFKKQIRQVYLNIAVGYYRLGIDKIEGTPPFNIPGVSTARNIDYTDGTNLLYSTTQYHYNNFSLAIGLTKQFRLGKTTSLELGGDLVGYYSLSQKYRLFDGPKYYTTNNKKPWEYGVNLKIGLLKTLGRFYIEPTILIPIYQKLKGDRVFYEDPKMDIEKWFNGIGLSLTIGRHLYKK